MVKGKEEGEGEEGEVSFETTSPPDFLPPNGQLLTTTFPLLLHRRNPRIPHAGKSQSHRPRRKLVWTPRYRSRRPTRVAHGGHEGDPLPFVPEGSPATSLVQSEEFYFKDGNFLLQVNNEHDFRVHRGIFAQSIVFADLFQVATRNEHAEIRETEGGVKVVIEEKGHEEVAVVKVQDNVAAWGVLLEALYRGLFVPFSLHVALLFASRIV